MDTPNSIPNPADVELTAYLIPLSAALRWPPPNTTNPEHRAWLIPFAIVLQVFATVGLAGRLWARKNKMAGGLAIDDGLVVVGWVFSICYTIAICYAIGVTGIGMHIWDQNPRLAAPGGLVAIFAQVAFLISTAATKISILLFYRRLIDRTINEHLLWGIYGGIAYNIAYMLAIIIFLATFCTPVSASWRSLDLGYTEKYKCASRAIPDPLAGVLSAAGDIYAIVIPEIVVAQLRLPQRRKIILYAIFGSGAVVVVAALIRTGYFVRFHTDPLRDLTWTAFDLFVWTMLELQFALIYACIPALKGFLSSNTSRKGTYNRNYYTPSSFTKQRSTTTEERVLAASPEPIQLNRLSSTIATTSKSERSWGGKEDIVVTRTVEVVSTHSRGSLEELESRTVATGRSFLDLSSPRLKTV